MSEQRRPWQPGDGLRCSQAGKAPRELPCGPPVVTSIKDGEDGFHRNGGSSTLKRVLCANHANTVIAPGEIVAKARRHATERILAENWDTYQEYMVQAVKELQAQAGDDQ